MLTSFLTLLFSLLLVLAGSVTASLSPPDAHAYFTLCASSDSKILSSPYTGIDYLEAKTGDLETCLHLLTIAPDFELIKNYVELLHSSFSENEYLNIINSKVETPTGLNMHPLSWLIYGNHPSLSSYLIEMGADVNHIFKKEVSSLLIAQRRSGNTAIAFVMGRCSQHCSERQPYCKTH